MKTKRLFNFEGLLSFFCVTKITWIGSWFHIFFSEFEGGEKTFISISESKDEQTEIVLPPYTHTRYQNKSGFHKKNNNKSGLKYLKIWNLKNLDQKREKTGEKRNKSWEKCFESGNMGRASIGKPIWRTDKKKVLDCRQLIYCTNSSERVKSEQALIKSSRKLKEGCQRKKRVKCGLLPNPLDAPLLFLLG